MNMVNGNTITKEMIWAAAERLLADGKQPKVASVRDILGKGSYSTINDAMKEWRAAQVKPEAPIRELAPAAISERLESFGGEIWAIAQEIATNRLKAEREALEAARTEMEAQQAETAEMADHLAAEIEQLRSTVDEMNRLLKTEIDARESLKQRYDAQAVNLAGVISKLDEKEIRITELNEEIKYSRTMILEGQQERDQILNKTQEEREQLLAKEREQIIENTKLKGQIERLEEKLHMADHHLSETKAANKTLKDEITQQSKAAQAALIETANYKGQVNQLQKQIQKGIKPDNDKPKG